MNSFLFTDEVAKRIAREPKEKSALPSLLDLSARKNLIPDTAIVVLYATLDAYQGKMGGELLSHLPSPDDLKKTYSACQFIEDDSEHYFPRLLRLFAMKLDFSKNEVVDYFSKLVNNFAFEESTLISDAGLVYQFISNPTVNSQNIDSLVAALKIYYDEVSVDQFLSLSFDYSYKTPELLNKLKESRAYSRIVNHFLSENAPSSQKLQNPFIDISERLSESYKLSDDSQGEVVALSRLSSSYLSNDDVAYYLEHVGQQFYNNLNSLGDSLKVLMNNCHIPDECSDLIYSAHAYLNSSTKGKLKFLAELIEGSVDCKMECPIFVPLEALRILRECTKPNSVTPQSLIRDEYVPLAERVLFSIDGASFYWKEHPEKSMLDDYKAIARFTGDETIYTNFVNSLSFLREAGPVSNADEYAEIDTTIISKYAERYGISSEFIDNHEKDENLGAFALGVLLLSNLPRAYITGDTNELELAIENGVRLLPHFKHAISSYINDLNLYRPLQFMLKEIHGRHGDNITVNDQTYSLSNILDELVNDLGDDSRYIKVQQDYISFLLKSKVESTPSVKLQLGARPTL